MGINGRAEGGFQKIAKLRWSGRRVECEQKVKRVGALRGRWRVDCEKMCEIKRVGALRGKIKKVAAGWIAKKCAKLRGSGRGWSAKIKRVGALRGGWRVDCKKNVRN